MKKTSLFENIKTLAFAIGLAMIFRSFLFEPFHIPSASMRPTMLEGDFLFVSKYSYGYSSYSFPFASDVKWFDGRWFKSLPQRGDVIVFRNPKRDELNFIKRVVGLPGDRIRVLDGRVILNGELFRYKRVNDFVFAVPGRPLSPILRYEEEMPNGHTHEVLDMTSYGALDNTKEYIVPEGHLFMMGDNRDDSDDSRVLSEVGYVPIENVVGKAQLILLSFDVFSDVSLSDPSTWIDLFRTDRFFKVIQ